MSLNFFDDKFKRILDKAVDYMLGIAAVVSIAVSLLYSLFALLPDIWFYTIPTIIYAIIFFIIFSLIFKNKKTLILSLVLFVIFILLTFVYCLINPVFLSGAIAFSRNITAWLQGYIFRVSAYEQSFGNVVVFGLTFIVSLFVYIFNVKKNTFLPYFLTGGIIFIMQSSIMKIHTSKPMFYLFIILTFIYWLRAIYNKTIKDKKLKSKGIYTVYILPCCILMSLTFLAVPQQIKPIIDKETTTKFFESIEIAFKTVEDLIFDKSRYFSVKSSGFNDGENILGGYLIPDNSIALKVKSTSSIYLKGRMYETYTGYSWETDNNFENIAGQKIENNNVIKNKNKENSFSLIYNLNIPFEYTHLDFIDDVANKSTIEITYEKAYTSSIFLPQYTTKINFNNIEPQIMSSNSMNLVTDKNNKRGFTYRVEFQKYSYGNEDLIAYLRAFGSGKFNINNFNSIMNDSNLVLLDYLSSWEMDAKKRKIYTQLPDSITPATKALAYELTKNYDNRYDKVRALENFLKDNYSYSKRIPNTPEGRDFVDYFLFDLNSGYCTYYATALSVMCRILNIPTRYVEGYVVPNASDDGYRYVTNDYAHAWTEVYFEGIGFIPFEATPIYNEIFYATESEYSTGGSGSYTPLEQVPVINEEDEVFHPEINNTVNLFDILMIVLSFIIFIIIVMMIIIYINGLKIKRFFKRTFKKSTKQQIHLLYRFYIDKLTLLGIKYQKFETPYEYAKRVENIMDINEITKIFVESFYGNKKVDEKAIITMKSFYNNLLNKVKKEVGSLNFIGLHYIWGKI